MRNDNMWRMAVVGAVTIFAILYVMPTLQYFLAISGNMTASPEKIEELRTRSVPLGLDLQGGVDVLLAVDVEQTKVNRVENLADGLISRFRQQSPAVDATVAVTTGPATAATQGQGAPQLVLTVNKQEQIPAVDTIMLDLKRQDYFPQYETGLIKPGQPLTLAVNPVMLTQDLEETVDSAWKVLHERVDGLGLTQPVVVRQGIDRIRVQIPGQKDPEQVVRTIIRPAVLEFKGVRTTPTPGPDGKYTDDSASFIDVNTGKPLPGKAVPPGYVVTPFKRQQRPDEVRPPGASEYQYVLTRRRAEMTGADIRDARVTVGQSNIGVQEIQVALEFNAAGTERFAQVTGEYVFKPLSIVLDGVVFSAPVINDRITGGNAVITGGFSHEEARSLAMVLKAGALPAELKTMDQRTVEATLGAASIRASVTALAIGSFLVALMMIAYYGMAGVISVVAIIINVFLIFAFMRMAGATLTLSGIGGILLTVGMAVDANVLIYERIREELHQGRSIRQAVSLGFGRAFSVIFDANLTTMICGLTLLQFGEGSVRGFALALIVGIIATLFTGLFCTRTLIEFWLNFRGRINVGSFEWFQPGFFFNFLRVRKFSYAFSGALVGLSVLYLIAVGPNWGVDFSGGVLSEVSTPQVITSQQVQGNHGDWRIQRVATTGTDTAGSQFIIRMRANENQDLGTVRQIMEQRLTQNIGEGQYSILGTEAVSNEVGQEFTWKAILACVIASILLLIYIAFRFEFHFGVAAVVALLHDLLIAFGLFNLLGMVGLAGEVTLDVVAALLVVLGYSVNDTIVVFDRIRENRRLHPGTDMGVVINRSISETMNRTTMTTGTTVLVLTIMLFMGGTGLYDFALVLLIGLIAGTYSSVFIASPVLYALYLRAKGKGGDIIRTDVVDAQGAGALPSKQ